MPTIAAPPLASLSSMNLASASPVAVVPPPIRISVPFASRSRRRALRSGDAASARRPSLIGNPCAMVDGNRGSNAVLRRRAGHFRGLQLVESERGERGGYLGGDRCSIVDPPNLERSIQLLEENAPSIDHCCCPGDFLVLAGDVGVGRKNRDAASGIANEVLDLPAL